MKTILSLTDDGAIIFKAEQTKTSIGKGSDNYFQIISMFKPSGKDIRKAQEDLGYNPKGYDGPWILEQNQTSKGWVTVFSCAGSCD